MIYKLVMMKNSNHIMLNCGILGNPKTEKMIFRGPFSSVPMALRRNQSVIGNIYRALIDRPMLFYFPCWYPLRYCFCGGYRVQSYPCFIHFKKGQKVDSLKLICAQRRVINLPFLGGRHEYGRLGHPIRHLSCDSWCST